MHTLTLPRLGAPSRFFATPAYPSRDLPCVPRRRPSGLVPGASRGDRPPLSPRPSHFCFASGFFTPSRSHACRTPWSVLQDGTIASLPDRSSSAPRFRARGHPPPLAFPESGQTAHAPSFLVAATAPPIPGPRSSVAPRAPSPSPRGEQGDDASRSASVEATTKPRSRDMLTLL